MADTKVSDLTSASPADGDALYLVKDVAGSPLPRHVLWTSIKTAMIITESQISDFGSYQPADADLDTWAGITPSANVQSLVSAADYAAIRELLDLEAGTDFYSISAADAAFAAIGHNHTGVYQPLDADLTAVAALTTTAAGLTALEMADPGVDRIVAWDDTAGVFVPIALADITDEASPAAGDFLLIYGAEGDLRRVDWDDLPSGGSGISNVIEDPTPELGGELDGLTNNLVNIGNIGATGIQLAGVVGVDVNPGSDIDADVFTIGVTGSPKAYWDESADRFAYTKGILLEDDILNFGGVTSSHARITRSGTEIRIQKGNGGTGQLRSHGLGLLDVDADPAPGGGQLDIWLSSGVATGEEGDLFIASNVSGVKKFQLFEYATGGFPNASISEANVTQHEAALSITESQISDLGSYQPLDADLTAVAALSTTAAGLTTLEMADPAADRVVAWDDTAGVFVPIALADITAEGTPASGDFVLIYGAEGDLRKVDWDDLPGSGGGISNVSEDTTPQLGGDLDANGFDLQFDDATGIRDDSDNEQLIFQKTASAVNYWEITNSATADPATQILAAVGGDTNINANIVSKGSGAVQANGNRVLTTADEGTGNGLDADTLDGNEATAFAVAAHNHAGVYQPADADLDTWAGISPSANVQSLVAAADYAAMRGLLDLEVDTDFYSISATDSAIATAVADYTPTADLASTSNGDGAALIGIEDSGNLITAATVEAALAEIVAKANSGVITFVIDGGGAEIATAIKGDLYIPFACTITAVTMLADQSGSIVVDIWKDSYANYPPTDADSITASAVPTISTAVKAQDATLTGWTTAISAGDTLRFNVDSVTDIQRVTITLNITKT